MHLKENNTGIQEKIQLRLHELSQIYRLLQVMPKLQNIKKRQAEVVKSSAIANHLTEWSVILWKDSHTPGNTTKLRLYLLFRTTYVINPYLVIMASSQLRKSLCKFKIDCLQLKIETADQI